MTDDETCPALVCTCGGAPFTPETAAGRSPLTLLRMAKAQDDRVRKLIDERIEAAFAKLADTIHYGTEAPVKVHLPRQQPLKEAVPSDPFGHAADVIESGTASAEAKAARVLWLRAQLFDARAQVDGLEAMLAAALGADPEKLQ